MKAIRIALPTLVMVAFNFYASTLKAQSTSEVFWKNLQKHCGKAYEGSLAEGFSDPDMGGKRLVIHFKSCEPNRIRVPFVVEDNRSRVWVFTYNNGRITLKHDHHNQEGLPEEITQYGGTATNEGSATMQIFPADQETAQLLDFTVSNVWWVTMDERLFTYNLKRLGTARSISLTFDLSQAVSPPQAPWGWKD